MQGFKSGDFFQMLFLKKILPVPCIFIAKKTIDLGVVRRF